MMITALYKFTYLPAHSQVWVLVQYSFACSGGEKAELACCVTEMTWTHSGEQMMRRRRRTLSHCHSTLMSVGQLMWTDWRHVGINGQ